MTGQDQNSPAPRVILVDDEEYALEEYRELLDMEGIACAVDVDPVRALETALASPAITVMVTDLRMPKMSGIELIHTLRQRLEPGRTIQFIVLSGYLEGLGEARALGDVVLLEKPVDADQLTEAIRRALEGSQNADESH